MLATIGEPVSIRDISDFSNNVEGMTVTSKWHGHKLMQELQSATRHRMELHCVANLWRADMPSPASVDVPLPWIQKIQ
jgi:hypothetical protein